MSDQLNLGQGIPESADFDDHAVQLPMPLILDPEVEGCAIATYAAMKSFGRRAEASLGAYAERLGWNEGTVRRWQKKLVQAQWLVLLREGKDATPRLWWMAKTKGEQPPLGAFLNAPLLKKQGGQKGHPKQGLYKGLPSNSNKETTQPQPKAEPSKHRDQDTWWAEAAKRWEAKHGSKLYWPGQGDQPPVKNFQATLTAALDTLGAVELMRRWTNSLEDEFTTSLSLRAFFADLARWAAAPRKKGHPNARQTHSPASTDHAAPHRPQLR